MQSAKYWIEKLELQKHPEGGWFKEIYRSEDVASRDSLPARFDGPRNFSTSIYFLLNEDDFSAFHRIKSDELWHYYTGTSAIEILLIINGKLRKQLLGSDFNSGERFQFAVPKNTWFAARLTNKSGFALVGCTVSPGFDFSDFEMADEKLLKKYPKMKQNLAGLIR